MVLTPSLSSDEPTIGTSCCKSELKEITTVGSPPEVDRDRQLYTLGECSEEQLRLPKQSLMCGQVHDNIYMARSRTQRL